MTEKRTSAEFDRYHKSVMAKADGQWSNVLRQLAPRLQDAIDRNGRNVPCPRHGGSDGFRIYHRDFEERGGGVCNTCGNFPNGYVLLRWVNEWNYWTTITEIGRAVGLPWEQNGATVAVTPPEASAPQLSKKLTDYDSPKKVEERRAALKATINAAVPVPWGDPRNPVVRYLTNRGLDPLFKHPPQDLFYHPALEYWADPKDVEGADPKGKAIFIDKFPCMLALVRKPDGGPVNIHRTYITADGQKATVPGKKVKKMMSAAIRDSMRGGAIRLWPAGPEMIVSEGLETAGGARLYVAAKERIWLPAWATYSSTMMGTLELEEQTEKVRAYADNDDPNRQPLNQRDGMGGGQKAAVKLANKHEHRVVQIFMPAQIDIDWCDEWNSLRAKLATQTADYRLQRLKAAEQKPAPASAPQRSDGIDEALLATLRQYGHVEIGTRLPGKPHVRLRTPQQQPEHAVAPGGDDDEEGEAEGMMHG